MNWHEYFISIAHCVSLKSKDPSTKVGAVIVSRTNEIITTGFNGFPRGIDETDRSRWKRPEKYDYVAHAEMNAVVNAARVGVSTLGSTLYLNFEPVPCTECTKAVIQAGITEIIGPDIKFGSVSQNPNKTKWEKSLSFAYKRLREAGITMYTYDAKKRKLREYK